MSKLLEMTKTQLIVKELDGVFLEQFEISKEFQKCLKQHNIVIAWGASDDLLELRGAIYDEIDAYEGTTVFVNKDGLFSDCESNCEHSQAKKKECEKLKLVWSDVGLPCWYFETKIPHEKFNIFDVYKGDKKVWCEGIVFCLDEIGEQREQ